MQKINERLAIFMNLWGIHQKQQHERQHKMHVSIIGNFKPCEACALGKARKADVSKVLCEKSKVVGEQLFIYTTSLSIEFGW